MSDRIIHRKTLLLNKIEDVLLDEKNRTGKITIEGIMDAFQVLINNIDEIISSKND